VNYRHAFHAGNFADCMKHILLLWLLRALARKEAGFLTVDTHAGIGHYDLSGPEATRTGEWQTGIGRLQAARVNGARLPDGITGYLDLVDQLGLYPGSPALVEAVLRPQDRLICCELHPEDQALLRRHFRGNAQVAVHLRDGYEAMRAFLPPKERRGLILIDPPYEQTAEFDTLTQALREAYEKFPGGVFAAWYPIKHRAPVRAFHTALAEAGIRDVVAAEVLLREPLDVDRLNGSGLLIVNPPWPFMTTAPSILQSLADILGDGEAGVGFRLTRVAAE
jgi:23S rRNA (adenine2030-N6)-methyltransferase